MLVKGSLSSETLEAPSMQHDNAHVRQFFLEVISRQVLGNISLVRVAHPKDGTNPRLYLKAPNSRPVRNSNALEGGGASFTLQLENEGVDLGYTW